MDVTNFWMKWSLHKIQKQIDELQEMNTKYNEYGEMNDWYEPLAWEDEIWLQQMIDYVERQYEQFPGF